MAGAQLQAFDPDGDPLAYSIVGGPFHGVTSGLNSNTGTFNYLPNLNYNGLDTLTFRVGDGKAFSPVDTVFFAVTPVNDSPVAQDVSTTTAVNIMHTFGAMPVTDADNVSWTISQTSGPLHGTVSAFVPSTGSFDYTPALDYQGPDSIRYVANDGAADSDTATIRITMLSDCSCPSRGDLNSDAVIDVFDVIEEIGIAFSGLPDIQDPQCPTTRGDVDNNGSADVFDVIYLIATAFSGGPNPINPCGP